MIYFILVVNHPECVWFYCHMCLRPLLPEVKMSAVTLSERWDSSKNIRSLVKYVPPSMQMTLRSHVYATQCTLQSTEAISEHKFSCFGDFSTWLLTALDSAALIVWSVWRGEFPSTALINKYCPKPSPILSSPVLLNQRVFLFVRTSTIISYF